MKKSILILVLIIGLNGCNENKKNNALSKKELNTKAKKEAQLYLEDCDERIALLAMSKQISGDTLKKVLTDYYTETYKLDSITIKDSEQIVEGISIKYNLPKSKIATYIFNYEFELLTPEEIYNTKSEEKEAMEAQEREEEREEDLKTN